MLRRRVLSLFWHNVHPDSSPDPDGASPTASHFRSQLAYILNRFQPISLDDFLAVQNRRGVLKPGRRPPVLLAFDDGFRNVLEVGLPILQEFDAPAVLFTLGQVVKTPNFVPWYVERKYLLEITPRQRVRFLNRDYDRSDAVGEAALRRAVYEEVLACQSNDDRQRLMDEFASSLGRTRPHSSDLPMEDRFVTREDLARLDESAGLTIASHAMTHWPLSTLSAEEQVCELRASHEILKDATRCYRPVVSYPNGSFDQSTLEAARQFYEMGFAVIDGSGYRRRFAYPRLGLGANANDVSAVINPVRLHLKLPVKRILFDCGFLRN